MKTTVEIADSLLEEGLRAVTQQERPGRRLRLRDGSFGGRGLKESLDWKEIRKRIYEGRGE